MSEDNKHIDQIEQYLNGELKGNELDAFKRRLETDAEFAQEVEMHKALIVGIEEARRDELRAFIKQNAKVRSGLAINTRWISAVAAMAVFAIGAFWFLNNDVFTKKQNEVADKRQDSIENQEVFEEKAIDELEKQPKPEKQKAKVEEPQTTPPELEVVEDDIEYNVTHDLAEVNVDEVEAEEKFEDYEEYDGEELRPELKSIERADRVQNSYAAPPVSKEDEIVVAKDIMTFDTTVTMQKFVNPASGGITSYTYSSSPDFGSININSTITLSDSFKFDKNEQAVKLNIDLKEKAMDTNAVAKVPAKKVTNETIAVQIEFWKSPINYKGYRFDTKNLMLYGVDKQTKVYIYKLEDKWYMKMGEMYYELITDNQFHTYKILEDESIIIQLGE